MIEHAINFVLAICLPTMEPINVLHTVSIPLRIPIMEDASVNVFQWIIQTLIIQPTNVY
jgi:hypothetical protein